LDEEGFLIVRLEVLASSLVTSLVVLPFLAWRWRISQKVAVIAALIVGIGVALVVNQIEIATGSLTMVALIPIELLLVILIPGLIIMVRFFRDPERTPTETENVVLSPADGKVIYANKVERGSSWVSTKDNRKFRLEEIMATDLAAFLIGIEMNLLNVHVNRTPIAGRVILRKHIHGKFLSLRVAEAESVNERVTTVVNNRRFSVAVIQIASRLVRRIVCYVNQDDELQIGQRIGAIVFGSQVDVAIPEVENLRIAVKPGDEVKAGLSVIARYGPKL
jgi:phosphatidylserine decarboxylase